MKKSNSLDKERVKKDITPPRMPANSESEVLSLLNIEEVRKKKLKELNLILKKVNQLQTHRGLQHSKEQDKELFEKLRSEVSRLGLKKAADTERAIEVINKMESTFENVIEQE